MSDPNSNRPNGNGRDAGGRFAKGNPGGPGSPVARHARQLAERLDDALMKVVSPDRLATVVDAILKLAEAGDVQAAKLLFDRVGGPPINVDLAARIEAMEQKLAETFEVNND